MKNCSDIKDLISRREHSLSETERTAIEDHLSSCQSCHSFNQKSAALASLMALHKPADDDADSAAFDAAFHKKLSEAAFVTQPDVPQQSLIMTIASLFKKQTAALMICSCCALLAGLFFFLGGNSAETDEQGVMVARSEADFGEPVTIELEYNAVRDLENVAFTIQLDDGIAFSSPSAEINALRTHSWKGDLKKGGNKIPFVVNVTKKGLFTVRTRAEFEGFIHQHKIILKSEGDKVEVTFFELPAKPSPHA